MRMGSPNLAYFFSFMVELTEEFLEENRPKKDDNIYFKMLHVEFYLQYIIYNMQNVINKIKLPANKYQLIKLYHAMRNKF